MPKIEPRGSQVGECVREQLERLAFVNTHGLGERRDRHKLGLLAMLLNRPQAAGLAEKGHWTQPCHRGSAIHAPTRPIFALSKRQAVAALHVRARCRGAVRSGLGHVIAHVEGAHAAGEEVVADKDPELLDALHLRRARARSWSGLRGCASSAASSASSPALAAEHVRCAFDRPVIDLNIDTIRCDGRTQMRVELSNDVSSSYAERMSARDPFPPIVVFYDGASYWLADGFHRVAARLVDSRRSLFRGRLADPCCLKIPAQGFQSPSVSQERSSSHVQPSSRA